MNRVATFMVMHRTDRVPIASVELLDVRLGDLRSALAREPDFRDAGLTAWGGVSHLEAERVVAGATSATSHDDLRADIDVLYSKAGEHYVSLHCCDPYSPHAGDREAENGE
jgi:hypothetical protein